jgi:hypothetical protein
MNEAKTCVVKFLYRRLTPIKYKGIWRGCPLFVLMLDVMCMKTMLQTCSLIITVHVHYAVGRANWWGNVSTLQALHARTLN